MSSSVPEHPQDDRLAQLLDQALAEWATGALAVRDAMSTPTWDPADGPMTARDRAEETQRAHTILRAAAQAFREAADRYVDIAVLDHRGEAPSADREMSAALQQLPPSIRDPLTAIHTEFRRDTQSPGSSLDRHLALVERTEQYLDDVHRCISSAVPDLLRLEAGPRHDR